MGEKRFTHEFWVGFLGILALLIIYFLINFFKGISIIDKGNTYYVKFDNIGEIVNSSPVFINGYKVGNVQDINYDFATRDGAFVELAIDSRLEIPVGAHIGYACFNHVLFRQVDKINFCIVSHVLTFL